MRIFLTSAEYQSLNTEFGIGRPQWLVLEAVSWNSWNADELAEWASEWSTGETLGTVTCQICRQAIDALINRQWLLVVDDARLQQLQALCSQVAVLEPLPTPNTIDFSDLGGSPFREMLARLESNRPSLSPDEAVLPLASKSIHYFGSHEAALAVIRDLPGNRKIRQITGPVSVPPYRRYWWEPLRAGVRVEVEYDDW